MDMCTEEGWWVYWAKDGKKRGEPQISGVTEEDAVV